jgi:phenylalanine ammonia-lyase
LYEAVKNATGCEISEGRPFVWNDQEQFLDEHISAILSDIRSQGEVLQSVGGVAASLMSY